MGAGARKGQNKNKITKEKETFYDKSSDPLFAVFSLLEQAVWNDYSLTYLCHFKPFTMCKRNHG